ncbi:MAG: IPT/TIG domain-containing protein [Myxococcales bacterium]|nr:IPT/TIG domain-containing protein [Myxococcales bacterium]
MRSAYLLCLAAALAVAGCDDGGSADPTPDQGAVLADAAVTPDADVGPTQDAAPVDAAPPEDGAPPPADGAAPPEALSINSLIPNRGPAEGGTEVRIIGTGFVTGMSFLFGGNFCADVRIESPNRARCKTPPGTAGAADVLALDEVELPDGSMERRQALLAGGFTYFEQVRLDRVTPARIPLRGGQTLVLEGSGLVEGTRVDIGGERAANVTVREDGSLTAIAPPGAAGPADVLVSNFNGMDDLPGGVFYFEDLTVALIDPPVGPLQGGIDAVLRGSGLVRDSRVTFGAAPAEVQDAAADHGALTVAVPAADAPGAVDVTVDNDNGQFTAPRGFLYYDADRDDFGVVGVAPASGPVEGGATVFVAGSGFTAQTAVSFDDRAIACELVDAHQLRCTTPPGLVGPVDVRVQTGDAGATLADGYTYFQTLELVAISPDRGAVAGGTVVTLNGAGFVEGMQVQLGGQDVVELQVIDETTARGVTPANTAGPVDVRVATEFSRSTIPGGFTYFDPVNRFGGVWGDPIDAAVNITVLNAGSGAPVDEAVVLLYSEASELSLDGVTNTDGQLTLSHPDLVGPATITAAKEGFEVTTVEDVEVENVTIYLQPNDGEGSPPPGVPAAILQGTISGLDLLPKPVNERYLNVVVVETTHPSPLTRDRLPPPGPGGLLLEDGAFEIIARPGELAVVATAGEIDRDALKAYEDGEIGYWDMRRELTPLKMGIRRFVSASPGQTIQGLFIDLDHPTDLSFPVDLDNPPLGGDTGPQYYFVLPTLNFGAEGFWQLDTDAVALDPALTLNRMPSLEGWDADMTYYLFAVAASFSDDNTPMAITIEETRDVDAGVLVTPFVGAPFFVAPTPGGTLGLDRLVTWGVFDGYDGPIRQPSANMVTIEEPGLAGPKPLWRYVTPSLVTEFEVPVLPAEVGTAGLGAGAMILTIIPFIVDGEFDFDEFTYDDLSQARWKSWGIATTFFTE